MTRAALMYSVPRSTPITADAADAVDEKRKRRPNSIAAGESWFLRRPGGAILYVVRCGRVAVWRWKARGGMAANSVGR